MKGVSCRRFLRAAVILFLFANLVPILHAKDRKTKPKKKSTAQLVFEQYPDLNGSKNHGKALAKENEIADARGLKRIEDIFELSNAIRSRFLVRVERSDDFYLDQNLLDGLHYAHPDAIAYLEEISEAYGEAFAVPQHKPLKITSLVRTEVYQRRLAKKNHNAAKGDALENRTVHTTGYAFDIGTKGLTQQQILWLADYLAEGIRQSRVLAIYEHKAQQDFHIFVIPRTPANSADKQENTAY